MHEACVCSNNIEGCLLLINNLVFIMPYCQRCSQQVEETALFCSNCGTPLKQQTQTEQSAIPPYGPTGRSRFGRYGGGERLREIIDRFRQKGAISPEKAMTIQELGLPPRFEEAMHRRLGQLGIFVEINGKYYLNEERLKEIQEQRAKGRFGRGGYSGWNREGSQTWSHIVGILLMLPIGIIIAFVLFYFATFRGGFFPGEFLIIFVVIFLVLTVVRLLFWSRRRY
jgi:hypothetical protein